MDKLIFDDVLISFGRPSTDISDYEYIKHFTGPMRGGLYSQLVVSMTTLSLGNLIRDFCGISGFTLALLSTEAALVIAAALTASLDLLAFTVFPDSYRPILELLKSTPRGHILDNKVVKFLLANQPEIEKVLNALVNEQFLQQKGDGEYIVRRRVLMHQKCDFI